MFDISEVCQMSTQQFYALISSQTVENLVSLRYLSYDLKVQLHIIESKLVNTADPKGIIHYQQSMKLQTQCNNFLNMVTDQIATINKAGWDKLSYMHQYEIQTFAKALDRASDDFLIDTLMVNFKNTILDAHKIITKHTLMIQQNAMSTKNLSDAEATIKNATITKIYAKFQFDAVENKLLDNKAKHITALPIDLRADIKQLSRTLFATHNGDTLISLRDQYTNKYDIMEKASLSITISPTEKHQQLILQMKQTKLCLIDIKLTLHRNSINTAIQSMNPILTPKEALEACDEASPDSTSASASFSYKNNQLSLTFEPAQAVQAPTKAKASSLIVE